MVFTLFSARRSRTGFFGEDTMSDAMRKPGTTGPNFMHDERDPHGTDQKAGGAKLDDGKVDILTYFIAQWPRAMQAVSWVAEYGARKYSLGGWKSVPQGEQRYAASGGRHILKQLTEGDYDDSDSGLAHLAQKAWNAMSELELAIRDRKLEVRRGNDIGADNKPILGTARAVKY